MGKTGHVLVLDDKGNYVISKDGEQDGENVADLKDANGLPFVQEVIKKGQSNANL